MTNGVADVDVDLAVIGGGRAGSTAITSLAQQYRATENAGDGRAMIADASAFLDPLYSPGVLLALRSKKAAEVDDARSVGFLVLHAPDEVDVDLRELQRLGELVGAPVSGDRCARPLISSSRSEKFSTPRLRRVTPSSRSVVSLASVSVRGSHSNVISSASRQGLWGLRVTEGSGRES